MPSPNVLVVAVDGLRASALGAYGNTSFVTSALDRFAADSLLLDYCYAPASDLSDVYRALWQSVHPVRPENYSKTDQTLPRLLANRTYKSTLISDAAELSAAAAEIGFDQCVNMATPDSEQPSRARNLSHTVLAQFFAVACDVIQQQSGAQDSANVPADSPRLIWIHSRGMYGPWDAPLSLQESLLDENDPPPLENTVPPDLVLSHADDPDIAFRYQCAYAAQIMVFDACWTALMETVATTPHAASWLVMLIGARGIPLGEHGRIGGVDPSLCAEQLHVPWLVRFPAGYGALCRSHALTSHLDLLPSIVDWIDGSAGTTAAGLDGTSILPLAAAKQAVWRDWLISTSALHKAIRTNSWCLRQGIPTSVDSSGEFLQTQASSELFVRPDDRWEANDVAKLCSEVVEQLARATRDLSQQIVHRQPTPLALATLEALACD